LPRQSVAIGGEPDAPPTRLIRRTCAGFRNAGQESRATFTGGRRPKAAKERTRGGMVRGECRALRYGDLVEAEGVSAGAQSRSRRLITRLADSSSSACWSRLSLKVAVAGWLFSGRPRRPSGLSPTKRRGRSGRLDLGVAASDARWLPLSKVQHQIAFPSLVRS
jgi:hypothetical protein